MTQTKGIDVSEYQSRIDWKKVLSDGYTFAILRCGYGRFENQKDAMFEQNYTEAKSAGLHIGAYLFSYAVTPEQAKEEALNCLRFLEGKTFDYPIAYDIETAAQQKLGKDKLSEIADTFCRILEEHGYYVCIYTSLSFLRNNLNKAVREKYDIWLAQWSKNPTYEGSFGMWQHSATGSVNGIRGAVDLDIAYKDYPSILKAHGLNGFHQTEPPKKTLYPGKEVFLQDTKLFSSSTTRFPSARINGNFFLYDGIPIHGRYRITNRASKAEKKPTWLFVTGYVGSIEIE